MSRTMKIFCALFIVALGWTGHSAPVADSPTVRVSTTGAVAPLELPGDARLEHQAELAQVAAAERERDAQAALQAASVAPRVTAAAIVTTTTSRPRPVPVHAVATPGSNHQRFVRLGDCESGRRWYDDAGNVHFVVGSADWTKNTGNGYYGGLQFSAATWHQAGGTGLPHEHTRDEQIAVAESWLARTSWAQWPECSEDLGYR